MPHLHLPTKHSDADLALAADIAVAVDSADLYVTWTHDAGAGALPEVEAVMRDERPVNPFAELFVAMMAGVVALFQHFAGAANAPVQRPATGTRAPRAAGEPSV